MLSFIGAFKAINTPACFHTINIILNWYDAMNGKIIMTEHG